MAQEAPNLLHAAIVFDGVAPSVLNSRGLIAASFNKIGAGTYRVQLSDPVDPTAVACAVTGVVVGTSKPLICNAKIDIVGGVYFLDILAISDASAAADGLISCLVWKFATDD